MCPDGSLELARVNFGIRTRERWCYVNVGVLSLNFRAGREEIGYSGFSSYQHRIRTPIPPARLTTSACFVNTGEVCLHSDDVVL